MTVAMDAPTVRSILGLNDAESTSRYKDDVITLNISASQAFLERQTHRWFIDRPAVTWKGTTMLRAQVALPGFRSFTSVTWGGATLVEDESFWALPDAQQSGVSVAIQFRPFRITNAKGPWYLADRDWWDKGLDSPFYPGNRGGGYAYTSMPNDLVIVGDGGYAVDSYPPDFMMAVLHLAAFLTKRPDAILADTIVTPAGGIVNYASLPQEARNFIESWQAGEQMASVG